MKKNIKKKLSFILISALVLSSGTPLLSWEPYDGVIAVVNDISIVESEINNKFNQLVKLKNIPRDKYTSERSRILDKFIEDALVMQAAGEESIVVGDKRVLTHLEDLMKQFFLQKIRDEAAMTKLVSKLMVRLEKKLGDETFMEDRELDGQLNNFITFLEGKYQITFKDYFEEVRSQIMREQVMSIAIGVTPPSKEEATDWFKKNKAKLGDEVWVKHILVRPVGGSLTAERDANQKISDLREKIIAGEPIEKLARIHSQDPESAGKGGDLGWKMLAEMEPYFAGYVNNIHTIGQVSPVFKSSMGYHVVKLMGRRPLTYDKVERLIMFKLYNESMFQQFKKWVLKRKKESEIQIFMKNYVAT